MIKLRLTGTCEENERFIDWLKDQSELIMLEVSAHYHNRSDHSKRRRCK